MRKYIPLTTIVMPPAVPLATRVFGKACEEHEFEFQMKFEAKGVHRCALQVAKDAEAICNVIGTSEAGSNKIVYVRG